MGLISRLSCGSTGRNKSEESQAPFYLLPFTEQVLSRRSARSPAFRQAPGFRASVAGNLQLDAAIPGFLRTVDRQCRLHLADLPHEGKSDAPSLKSQNDVARSCAVANDGYNGRGPCGPRVGFFSRLGK